MSHAELLDFVILQMEVLTGFGIGQMDRLPASTFQFQSTLSFAFLFLNRALQVCRCAAKRSRAGSMPAGMHRDVYLRSNQSPTNSVRGARPKNRLLMFQANVGGTLQLLL